MILHVSPAELSLVNGSMLTWIFSAFLLHNDPDEVTETSVFTKYEIWSRAVSSEIPLKPTDFLPHYIFFPILDSFHYYSFYPGITRISFRRSTV